MKIITGFVALMLISSMTHAAKNSTNDQDLFDTTEPHKEQAEHCRLGEERTKDGYCLSIDPICPEVYDRDDPSACNQKGNKKVD